MSRDKIHYPTTRRMHARRVIVSELYLKGYTYMQIIRELKNHEGMERTSTATISKDVHAILDEWREQRLGNAERYVTLELARIDTACRELWEEWEKSKNNGERTANVQYIAEIRAQLAERRKLLGLYAPEKRELSGPGGLPIPFADLSDREIEEEMARIEAALAPPRPAPES